jgi:hypothetical protein
MTPAIQKLDETCAMLARAEVTIEAFRQARQTALAEALAQYPDGKLPDGRTIRRGKGGVLCLVSAK